MYEKEFTTIRVNTVVANDSLLTINYFNLKNEKIASYKTKINDTQSTLSDLNAKLEMTRKSYFLKQSEVEMKEKEVMDTMQKLAQQAQEKVFYTEKQKNFKIESPFGLESDDYNDEELALKTKQSAVQQLKSDLEKMESQINSTRTQLEVMKHELEVGKSNEADYIKENTRLENLLNIKRNNSITNNSLNKVKRDSVHAFKTSPSTNNIRSATPANNYDALKDEIMKIQAQNSTGSNPASKATSPTSGFAQSITSPIESKPSPSRNGPDFNVDWSNAFDRSSKTDPFAVSNTSDPFASFSESQTTDPFNTSNTQGSPGNKPGELDASWPASNKSFSTKTKPAFEDPFASAFNNSNNNNNTPTSAKPSIPFSNSFNGFGADDNWASLATDNNNAFNNADGFGDSNAINNNDEKFDAFNSTTSPTNETNANNDNWAAFSDGTNINTQLNDFD